MHGDFEVAWIDPDEYSYIVLGYGNFAWMQAVKNPPKRESVPEPQPVKETEDA